MKDVMVFVWLAVFVVSAIGLVRSIYMLFFGGIRRQMNRQGAKRCGCTVDQYAEYVGYLYCDWNQMPKGLIKYVCGSPGLDFEVKAIDWIKNGRP